MSDDTGNVSNTRKNSILFELNSLQLQINTEKTSGVGYVIQVEQYLHFYNFVMLLYLNI